MPEGDREPPAVTGGMPAAGSRPKVSFILATYNEEDTIPVLLRAIEKDFPATHEDIVIDDNSTDRTREFLREWQRTHPNLVLIFNPGKQTLLRAHYQGLLRARGEFSIVMDTDLQHPPELLPELYRKLEDGFDLVVGSRYLPGGSTGDRIPFRGLISRGAAGLAKAFLPASRDFTDPLSGYLGVRTALVPHLEKVHRGYKIGLFLMSTTRPRRVCELPYTFRERTSGQSKIVKGVSWVRLYLRELHKDVLLKSRLARGRLALNPPGPPTVGAPGQAETSAGVSTSGQGPETGAMSSPGN